MTIERFTFQRECAAKYTGTVLNIGCATDPANLGHLNNVVNCDNFDHSDITGEIFPVDKVFDATDDKWPFKNNSVDLVIFGDVIEHWYPEELRRALKEAARVAKNICATVPRDERIYDDPNYFDLIKDQAKGSCHVFVYSDRVLTEMFEEAGFDITRLDTVDYGFCPVGYFIEATKKSGNAPK